MEINYLEEKLGQREKRNYWIEIWEEELLNWDLRRELWIDKGEMRSLYRKTGWKFNQ